MQQLHKFNYKSLNMPFRRPDLEKGYDEAKY
jgi:hypothetical protein